MTAILIGGVIVFQRIADQTVRVAHQDKPTRVQSNISADTATPTPADTPPAASVPAMVDSIVPVVESAAPRVQPTISFTPTVEGEQYDTQKAAVNITTSQVHKAFKDNDSQALYNLFSSQLTTVFTAENLAEAFGATGNVNLEPIGDPVISTEWAKQRVSYTHDGSTTQYDMVLHLEDGEWKLFGTMSLDGQ